MLPLRLESRAPALPPSRLVRPLRPARQQGVAMVVVLMLMLALMGIVAFSARNANFSEMSSRNQLDGEIARQAAESALRDAERDLLLIDGSVLANANAKCKRDAARPLETNIAGFSPTCLAGQCDKALNDYKTTSWVASSSNAEPWWPNDKGGMWGDPSTKPKTVNAASCSTFTGGVPIGLYTGAPAVPGVAIQPEYLIEQFSRAGGRIIYYRITARGFGVSDRTQVVLQSYFQPYTLK
jgi:type IV pilus assembly protein PilX